MSTRKMDESEIKRYGDIVWNYASKVEKFKLVKKKFERIREEFEEEMESLFSGRSANSVSITKDPDGNDSVSDGAYTTVKITKVQRTSILWDIDKLRKRIPKNILSSAIKKEYRVVNMPQLIQYLKSCGVDPKIFRQFIDSSESVDQDEVDRLGDLGYITPQQISGCYTVECSKPFYRINATRKKE